MPKPEIKMPMQHLLSASLDMLRLRGDLTDALVLCVNQRTGEAKIGSLRGDAQHCYEMLARAMQSIQKQRNGNALAKNGLILPS